MRLFEQDSSAAGKRQHTDGLLVELVGLHQKGSVQLALGLDAQIGHVLGHKLHVLEVGHAHVGVGRVDLGDLLEGEGLFLFGIDLLVVQSQGGGAGLLLGEQATSCSALSDAVLGLVAFYVGSREGDQMISLGGDGIEGAVLFVLFCLKVHPLLSIFYILHLELHSLLS